MLAGATPDSGNQGVAALALSVLAGIARRAPGAELTVLDHGLGTRRAKYLVGTRVLELDCCGFRYSRRIHRSESHLNTRLSARLGRRDHPVVRCLSDADAILDITGGDSFTDLYGQRRFRAGCEIKSLAIDLCGKLVLLPQTYGPFRRPAHAAIARRLLIRAASAWARDARSFERMRELLGDGFDPARHRAGVDVAFLLPGVEPRDDLPADVSRAMAGSGPLVGLNVSGLIMNDAEGSARFGFKADYRAVVTELVTRLLRETDATVLLVPHVTPGRAAPLVRQQGGEGDDAACMALAAGIARADQHRVAVVPPGLDAMGLKWIIGRCDWFCGTRMHSTIAALSSGTACAAIAYSDKTLGVFESCGQGEQVVDPRTADTSEVVERLLHAFERRNETRASLASRLPASIEAAERQMDEIMQQIGRDSREPAAA